MLGASFLECGVPWRNNLLLPCVCVGLEVGRVGTGHVAIVQDPKNP